MTFSERLDRRYQQAPTGTIAPPGQAAVAPQAVPAPAAVPTPSADLAPTPSAFSDVAPELADLVINLSPALAAAKAEIHAQLLSHHTAQIDINNPPGIRRLLLQLTEEHFRAKPPTTLVTAADRERLVEVLFDEVVGLGPLEALLRDPDVSEVMVNRPEQIFVERKGKIELTNLAFEDEASLRRVIDRIVSSIGRRVDESEPMCDARLKDGSRVNVVIPPVAIYGPCLNIRKFGREVLTPQKIVATAGSPTRRHP